MTTHELKADRMPFDAMERGEKTCEVRRNDRNYQVGHDVLIRETLYTGEQMRAGSPLIYTGRKLRRAITHIQAGYGLPSGIVVLSLAAPDGVGVLRQQTVSPAHPDDSGKAPHG